MENSLQFTVYRKIMRRQYFTIAELVAVVAIILIVSGLVVGQIGRVPAFASLERSVSEVERLFSYASYLAVTRGKTVAIVYSPGKREFRLAEAVTEEKTEDTARKYLNDQYGTMRINPGIDFEMENVDEQTANDTEFLCFPDGSTSGPPMKFTLKKHTMKIRISPLTGTVIREEAPGE